jgi:hypothetical protein
VASISALFLAKHTTDAKKKNRIIMYILSISFLCALCNLRINHAFIREIRGFYHSFISRKARNGRKEKKQDHHVHPVYFFSVCSVQSADFFCSSPRLRVSVVSFP